MCIQVVPAELRCHTVYVEYTPHSHRHPFTASIVIGRFRWVPGCCTEWKHNTPNSFHWNEVNRLARSSENNLCSCRKWNGTTMPTMPTLLMRQEWKFAFERQQTILRFHCNYCCPQCNFTIIMRAHTREQRWRWAIYLLSGVWVSELIIYLLRPNMHSGQTIIHVKRWHKIRKPKEKKNDGGNANNDGQGESVSHSVFCCLHSILFWAKFMDSFPALRVWHGVQVGSHLAVCHAIWKSTKDRLQQHVRFAMNCVYGKERVRGRCPR